MIGKQILLISKPNPQIGQTVVMIPVTVVEEKDVFGKPGEGKYTGYKAKDEKGKEYTWNWDSFHDDGKSGISAWDDPNGTRYYDILSTLGAMSSFKIRPLWLENYPFLDYCKTHKIIIDKELGCHMSGHEDQENIH